MNGRPVSEANLAAYKPRGLQYDNQGSVDRIVGPSKAAVKLQETLFKRQVHRQSTNERIKALQNLK